MRNQWGYYYYYYHNYSFPNLITFMVVIIMIQLHNIHMIFYNVQSIFIILNTDNGLYHFPQLFFLAPKNTILKVYI